ncbi:P-loop containing nucleoside triphosphate hydrolase protein [Lentinula raphanica]|uniref:Thymidylate kinase n=1 Tax=Lentinula raphanica TaxID=153919 RepID=A0AA38P915_9AGAR|nr:P-loop containing nucleoside triphosphate hydrolase protein [Lentinula raphanica]KAJ3838360.1 P-loop containing nucleoside triphosphate hydrolase protein [Lentinula raphanica]KAJ3968077.1 P-loop containing nucleoside triphosphate hydrolase protein [Lentinula raphanica]
MTRRGAFIVVEGLDRSGKTTQTDHLRRRICEAGKEVLCVKFPDRSTPIGKMIDAYLHSQSDLDDHVVHLLFSANRWELAPTIISALEQGKIVLCDRYAFSGIAFSVAKSLPSLSSLSTPQTEPSSAGKLPSINLSWARAPDATLPSPDLTLFLDVSPEIALTRGGYGEERYEKADMQNRVRSVFEDIGREVDTGVGNGKWVVVDAGKEMSVVTEEMWEHVQPLLDGVDGSIARLWEHP